MTRHEQSNGTQPLLRPARLGDLHLPNRVVMAPLTRSRAAAATWSPPTCTPPITPSGPPRA